MKPIKPHSSTNGCVFSRFACLPSGTYRLHRRIRWVGHPLVPETRSHTRLPHGINSVATSFAISRRRMVVPIYKKWETSSARLQILRQDRIVQLVAFFQDFSHGDCMNFHLKGTDVFESFSKSGKHCIRIVDAKFALPKGEGVNNKGFVCLDMPEYPAEHDDITIAFDLASGKALSPPSYLRLLPSARRMPNSELTCTPSHSQIGIGFKTLSPRTLCDPHEWALSEDNTFLPLIK